MLRRPTESLDFPATAQCSSIQVAVSKVRAAGRPCGRGLLWRSAQMPILPAIEERRAGLGLRTNAKGGMVAEQ
jgi:hypothetical protein